EVQDRLFTIGSTLAADPQKNKMVLPQLNETDSTLLEKSIDEMEKNLPALRSFILPGGHTIVSYCHIARCVCRRAERNTNRLNETEPVHESIIKYLNRLSDYLFVLSRSLSNDLKASETAWKPKT
ncbi:MAG: cob(I)yrinic acid a,c-diamide adenosyltransferase, partial [Bacteroidia bacterium]|nr:cob(I)yrinic acid a,c-diamide adenosyltransferase [Bacteroidia bacterium]